MVAKRLLDENSLNAIKTYVDSKAEESGKVDDVRINSTSVVDSKKVANIEVDGTYDASTNKIATQSTVANAINALDVSDITGFGAGKTLATLIEENGKIGATFQDIQLASTAKVTGLDEALASKVPTSLNSHCYRQMYYNCSSLKFASSSSITGDGRYSAAYRIPTNGTASGSTINATYQMLTGTGGTFTVAPTLGTIYYGFIPN